MHYTFIYVSQKMLAINLGLPSKYKGKTLGLTGYYDDDKSNDLKGKDGNVLSIDSSESDIFTWASQCKLVV